MKAGLSTVDIAYTYTTPILGDYDFDSKITHNDLWDLVENWEMKNFNYELGPVSGKYHILFPSLIVSLISRMGWHCSNLVMVSKRIWTNSRGYSNDRKPLNIAQLENDLFIFIDDSIASGQIHFSNNDIDSKLRFLTKSHDGAMYLSHQMQREAIQYWNLQDQK